MNLTFALDRILDPLAICLTSDAAERIVQLQADEALQTRMNELADKANEGQLTTEEEQEYDAYLRGLTMVSVLQAKARVILRRTSTDVVVKR